MKTSFKKGDPNGTKKETSTFLSTFDEIPKEFTGNNFIISGNSETNFGLFELIHCGSPTCYA